MSINKAKLTETDIISKYIMPAIKNAGWDDMSQIRQEVKLRDGKVIVRGQYWGQLYDNAAGTGQPNINETALKSLLFLIQPLEEQHRIVAKVDKLMALCDQLKARLSDAKTTQLHLTDAIVEQAM